MTICAFLPQVLGNANAQSQITNAPSHIEKAYKTLNFGDNSDIVDRKLHEILGRSEEQPISDSNVAKYSETFWRALFDTDAEYEPYEYESRSGKFKSLMHYFERFRVAKYSLDNSAISVDCYQLYDTTSEGGKLAIVEVSYKTFALNKLIDAFIQNYPNARKGNKPYRFENTMYPGIFIEFKRTFLSDINQDRRATLSIPTGKFAFTFTDPSKLSKAQLAIWEGLMTEHGKTSQMKEFFELVKTSFLTLAKNIEEYEPSHVDASEHGDRNFSRRLDPITNLGWYGNRYYSSIIYGAPSAVFASKQILEPIVSDYRKSVEAEAQKEKAKLKKDAESATDF